MAAMTSSTHKWRAQYFRKAYDQKPTRIFVIAAHDDQEAEMIAHRIMLDYERVDLHPHDRQIAHYSRG